jgi:hypothetical protein
VRAANTVSLDDILLGDLWLASGQSNMEMPLAGFSNAPLTTVRRRSPPRTIRRYACCSSTATPPSILSQT